MTNSLTDGKSTNVFYFAGESKADTRTKRYGNSGIKNNSLQRRARSDKYHLSTSTVIGGCKYVFEERFK